MAPYRLHRGIDARDVARAHARSRLSRSFFLAFYFRKDSFRRGLRRTFLNAPPSLQSDVQSYFMLFQTKTVVATRSVDRVYDSSLATKILAGSHATVLKKSFLQFDALSSEVLPIRSTWLAVE